MSQEARALVVQYLLGQVQQPEQAIEEFCKLNSSVSPPSDAASPDAETAYAQLKSYVRHILGLIKEDNLALAGTELVQISQWVKTNAVNLGLCNDDVDSAKRDEKIYVWELFNFCWLAALQKQKELSISGGPSLLDAATMKSMGHEVVSCGNGLEKFGLVDYQQGLWESKIIDVLDECIGEAK